MAVATAAAAGGNGEGFPPPTGIAATAANGSQQGYPAEGVLVVGSMAPRAEGVPAPVIELTAMAGEEEEEKKDHSTAYTRRESWIDLNLTPPAEEEGEDEKEGQGVDGPRAESVPVIDLTEESNEEEEEVRWVGQYSSTQSILLVGDGDFSFSLALATGFGSGANLVATSLDSYDTLKKKYSGAESNLAELKKMGAVTLHGVNAKTMKLHTDLKTRRFDRVIFNFPHAGFKGKENHPHMINSHRKLVKDFFRSASLLLRPDGEVHVSHKTKNPYRQWNLEELASEFALFLVEQVDFRIQDYPGYSNKRGDGLQCDLPFLLGKCSTFKFKIGDIKNTKRVRKLGPTAYSGDSRNAYFSDPPISFGPSSPALPLLVPKMPQPCVPFHMPSVPVFSEFLVHEAAPWWYRPAEAGIVPWHRHPLTWGSSW